MHAGLGTVIVAVTSRYVFLAVTYLAMVCDGVVRKLHNTIRSIRAGGSEQARQWP